MDSKAPNPVELLQGRSAPALVLAYFELCQLKQLFRQGWLRRGVSHLRCESVAEHSFGMAVLGLWLRQAYFPELDEARVLKMALLHEMGEIYAGDIVPGDPVSSDEKHRLEAESVVHVLNKLPGGQAWVQVWLEFEAGETPEARFVRQLDRLEMGLQAVIYRAQGFERMDEFIRSAERALQDEQLQRLLAAAVDLNLEEE